MSTENWIEPYECMEDYQGHNFIELDGNTGTMFCTRCRMRTYVDICIGICGKSIDPRDTDIERDTIYVWHTAC